MECLKASISIIDKSLPEGDVRLLDLIYIAKVVNECILAALLERIHRKAIAIEVRASQRYEERVGTQMSRIGTDAVTLEE